MTLNRWDPLKDLLNFQDRMHRVVVSACGEGLLKRSACWCPVVDVLETPEAFIFRADLPGVGRDNINIEVRGNRLKISGQRPQPTQDTLAVYHSCERSCGFFERTFNLPGLIDVDAAQANYDDGILEVIIPKAREERQRSIKVLRPQ
jgi:HSP20 family protein